MIASKKFITPATTAPDIKNIGINRSNPPAIPPIPRPIRSVIDNEFEDNASCNPPTMF
jgi:hypothetical protein